MSWSLLTRTGFEALEQSGRAFAAFRLTAEPDLYIFTAPQNITPAEARGYTRLRDEGIEVRWLDGSNRMLKGDALGQGWFFPRRVVGGL